MLRQRKSQADDHHPQEPEPLDEADQAQMVENIQKEMESQQHQVDSLFQKLCQVVSIVTPLVAILVWRWDDKAGDTASGMPLVLMHATLSSLWHWTLPQKHYTALIVANLLITGIGSWLSRRQQDTDRLAFHYLTLLGNVLLGAVAIYLKYDKVQSGKLLGDLKGSQYQFKSL